jgi:hypothetical protein
VEAFVSPTTVPARVKFLLAGGLATLLVLYLARKPRAAVEDSQPAAAGSAISAAV